MGYFRTCLPWWFFICRQTLKTRKIQLNFFLEIWKTIQVHIFRGILGEGGSKKLLRSRRCHRILQHGELSYINLLNCPESHNNIFDLTVKSAILPDNRNGNGGFLNLCAQSTQTSNTIRATSGGGTRWGEVQDIEVHKIEDRLYLGRHLRRCKH